MSAETLPINETFVSLQGEGPRAGQRAFFVRLQGCPVKCLWCDTKYTWHADHITPSTQRSVASLEHELVASEAKVMVLTGGEPMTFLSKTEHPALNWQENPAFDLITRASCVGVTVEVETSAIFKAGQSGSEAASVIARIDKSVTLRTTGPRPEFRLSPKLPSAKAHTSVSPSDVADIARFLWYTSVIHVFKLVVDPDDKADVEFVNDTVRLFNEAGVDRSKIILMPKAGGQSELAANSHWVAAMALEKRCSYSHRIHIDLFGGKRGH